MEDDDFTAWGGGGWGEEEEEEAAGNAGRGEAGGERMVAAGLTARDVAACCKVLDALAKDADAFSCREMKCVRSSLQPHVRAMMAGQYGGAGPEGRALERAKQAAANSFRQQKAAHDRNAIQTTALREGRSRRLEELTAGLPKDHPHRLLVPDGASLSEEQDPSAAGGGEEVPQATFKLQSCYVCKCRYNQLHHFYDRLCPTCADLNYAKRMQWCNLKGHVAVVTGSRVKIGFHVCLKLLRMGATVVATTRFPMDSGGRFAKEKDYAEWSDRLHIIGLDLRDIAAVEEFAKIVKTRFIKVDLLINNACQTIRRPAQYYSPLVHREAILSSSDAASDDVYALHIALNSALARKDSLPRPIGGKHDGALGGSPYAHSSAAGDRGSLEGQETRHGQVWSVGRIARSAQLSQVRMTEEDEEVETGGVIARSAQLSQVRMTEEDEEVETGGELLPSGATDVNGQQIDLRRMNSWLLKMDQVSTSELLEVMLINAIAPFVLTAKILPLMQHTNTKRHIVHVSAMEGKFYRYKTPHHPHTNMAKAALNMLTRTSAEVSGPHTNMAKAALNMLTRTSAEDLMKRGIFVNSVDTGWINDENPHEKSKRYADAANWQTAIDEVDAAARILDPIVTGVVTGECPSGQFLKDYAPTEW